MRLAVLGSGSRGNAVAARADGVSVLVDAGFGPRTLARRAREVDLSLEPLGAVIVTHEHGDHARAARLVARRYGCSVLGSPGTLAALPGNGARTRPLHPRRAERVGPFTVQVAASSHDASDPVAVALTGPCGTKIGIAYDLGRATAGVRYLLRDCSVLVLEANHDDVLLRTGPYPASVRQRIAGSGGHLSNRAAAELAADLCSQHLETVVLVHVSEQCNRPDLARDTVTAALAARRFGGEVLVAGQRQPLAVPVRGHPQLAFTLPEARPLR